MDFEHVRSRYPIKFWAHLEGDTTQITWTNLFLITSMKKMS